VEAFLGPSGFEMCAPETLTLRDQVELFSQAEVVVSTHGGRLHQHPVLPVRAHCGRHGPAEHAEVGLRLLGDVRGAWPPILVFQRPGPPPQRSPRRTYVPIDKLAATFEQLQIGLTRAAKPDQVKSNLGQGNRGGLACKQFVNPHESEMTPHLRTSAWSQTPTRPRAPGRAKRTPDDARPTRLPGVSDRGKPERPSFYLLPWRSCALRSSAPARTAPEVPARPRRGVHGHPKTSRRSSRPARRIVHSLAASARPTPVVPPSRAC